MTQGIKTSEFWSHVAISTGAFASVVGTVFDKAFVSNHPALAAGVSVAGILAMALSQASYAISRGIAKQGQPVVPTAPPVG